MSVSAELYTVHKDIALGAKDKKKMEFEQVKAALCDYFSGMPAETTTAICSLLFGGVLERFPKLKLCFAHGGEQQYMADSSR